MKINFAEYRFLKSAAKLSQLPAEEAKEIAFCGRSNAGKSSMLNLLCSQKDLARTSSTPGRTQLINIFSQPTANLRLIDLPGYGFAKAPVAVKKKWENLIAEYLRLREELAAVVLLMDIRHPLQKNDMLFLNWIIETATPCRIVLSKADKVKSSAQKRSLLDMQKKMTEYDFISIQLFSTLKKIGLNELRKWLEQI